MDRVGLVADNLGVPYGAMKFDGVSSYVDCGNNASISYTDKLTVCAWVNPSAVSGTTAIVSKVNAGTGNGFWLARTGASSLLFEAKYGDTWDGLQNDSVFSLGVPVFVAVTYDGSDTKLYKNGTQVTHENHTGNIATNSYALKIGKAEHTGSYFNGLIWGARVYNRCLSSNEILSIYNNQPVSSTGLVAQWKPKTVDHMGATTFDFADSTSASYGLQNVTKPWIAIYSPTDNYLDFYLFTHRSKNLSYKRDENGNVYELTLYPGNGLIYWGRITYPNPILDSDSNLIPNCLEASVEGSLTKFLQSYGMVI
jgi:hypothetical protein